MLIISTNAPFRSKIGRDTFGISTHGSSGGGGALALERDASALSADLDRCTLIRGYVLGSGRTRVVSVREGYSQPLVSRVVEQQRSWMQRLWKTRMEILEVGLEA